MASCWMLTTLILLSAGLSADAKGFLGNKGKHRKVDAHHYGVDVKAAMDEVMGCGGQIPQERLAAIETLLTPMWKTLPKNSYGRIERRSLRYMAHRYFTMTSSLWVRGFEPTRPVNHSAWGSEDILSQRVPAFVESVLESHHAQAKGFDLADAVRLVATLKQLIFDSEGMLLDKVYKRQRKLVSRSLSAPGLQQILEEYMVHWMMGDDQESIQILLSNKSLLQDHVPHWDMTVSFVHGKVRELDYQRQESPTKLSRPGHNALSPYYSYEDVHNIVGGVTGSFASFWQSECWDMKASLVEMDPQRTGRVPMSKFYSSALETEWRFGESESYLRDLGVLDETSSRGKQVLIANYIQGASNCIVSAPHYMVCCVSECEAVMGEIERTIGTPLALPSDILPVVGNMTPQTTVDHDDLVPLSNALVAQLEQIAATHGGRVPLHGRLFAQWLHFVFPHECVFPHMTGTASTATPTEFGDSHIATQDEMKQHVKSKGQVPESEVDKEELQWMSQWSEEEELLGSYAELQESPLTKHLLAISGVGLAVLSFLGIISRLTSGTKDVAGQPGGEMSTPSQARTHFV